MEVEDRRETYTFHPRRFHGQSPLALLPHPARRLPERGAVGGSEG